MFVVWWLSWKNRNYYGRPPSRSWYGVSPCDGQYRCLLCGAVFPQGEVFPRGGRFYDAEAMAALHLREAHGSVLEYLLHRNPGLLGLSEVQLELLRMLAEGCTDKEIAAQKRVSPSPCAIIASSSGKRSGRPDSFWPDGAAAYQPHLQPGGYRLLPPPSHCVHG